MLALIKHNLNCLRDSILECFLSLEQENIIKDITYHFRLHKEQTCTAFKDIRN